MKTYVGTVDLSFELMKRHQLRALSKRGANPTTLKNYNCNCNARTQSYDFKKLQLQLQRQDPILRLWNLQLQRQHFSRLDGFMKVEDYIIMFSKCTRLLVAL
jgi:hypothetical protein